MSTYPVFLVVFVFLTNLMLVGSTCGRDISLGCLEKSETEDKGTKKRGEEGKKEGRANERKFYQFLNYSFSLGGEAAETSHCISISALIQ